MDSFVGKAPKECLEPGARKRERSSSADPLAMTARVYYVLTGEERRPCMIAAASPRRLTFSFERMLWTWFLTVAVLIPS